MCVVSQIMDYGRQNWPYKHPDSYPYPWPPNTVPNTSPPMPVAPPSSSPLSPPTLPSPEEMQRWIAAFRKLVEAGEEFDKVTGQPDCVDPEKQELMERIAELERRLESLEGNSGD